MTSKNRKRLCLPQTDLIEAFHLHQNTFPGLGKSTKRGIKKCSKCGVYNGTRSSMCKNKKCGVILKDCEEKSKVDLDAVKLFTGTEKQLYSVRVKDMGPDYRGFVQLPTLHLDGDSNIFSEVALCFADSCQSSFDNSILKCHEEDQDPSNLFCEHIKSALKSQSTASPIALKNDILHALKVGNNVKEKLYLMATEKEGCLVQRVSKSIMAVQCQVSPKHPLGYLHFTFFKAKGKDYYEKYFCSCTEFVGSESLADKYHLGYKCIHYYACIWGSASEVKHAEFSYFLKRELNSTENVTVREIPVTVNEKHPSNQLLHKVRYDTKLKNKNSERSTRKDQMLKNKEAVRRCQKIMPKIIPVEVRIINDSPMSDNADSWKFIDWLSYVTECINKTMQFENCGLMNTLGFQIPENFYQCFMKRIPTIYNVTLIGSSSIYNVMNIVHLKEIFDTTQVKLRISKKFVHVQDKGYVEYNENLDENEIQNDSFHCPFIFFFNVGQSTVDESDNTNNSFYIEWTPSIMGFMNVGHLKFEYKYGRKST